MTELSGLSEKDREFIEETLDKFARKNEIEQRNIEKHKVSTIVSKALKKLVNYKTLLVFWGLLGVIATSVLYIVLYNFVGKVGIDNLRLVSDSEQLSKLNIAGYGWLEGIPIIVKVYDNNVIIALIIWLIVLLLCSLTFFVHILLASRKAKQES